MAQKQSVIEVDEVTKQYGRKTVIESISLQLPGRSVVGLLGPNGAGKTSLFYIISGLIRPDKGRVFLDAMEITKLPMHQRAKLGIGYLPQEASIFTHLSVAANIQSIAQLHSKDCYHQTETLLDEFNLQPIRHSLGYQLSGGERRRVEIARALVAKPRFILLDEPFAGVDPISINETKQTVCDLVKRGIGVIITDHNVRETLSICDKAYILGDGRLIAQGAVAEIISNQRVRQMYLGEDFSL